MKNTLITTLCLASITGALSGSVTFTGNYTQTFDTLPSTGNVTAQSSASTWVDDTTLDGWYATGGGFVSGIAISDGASTLLSSNSSSTASLGDDADRALGVAKRNNNSFVGLNLLNDTGVALSDLKVSYSGEQWRENSTGPYTTGLVFEYSTDATSLSDGTWTAVSALNFVLPVVNNVNSAVDGNVAGQVNLSNTFAVSIANGDDIWLRWSNVSSLNNNGNYVGIDNVTVVPEPSTYAIILGAFGLALVIARRRKIAAVK